MFMIFTGSKTLNGFIERIAPDRILSLIRLELFKVFKVCILQMCFPKISVVMYLV